MTRLVPMSSVDAAWLGMEDPTNLMMVTGVLALDGKVDIKRLRTLLDKRLAPFGRFHQRVARPRMRGGMLHWQDDSQFDIDNHVSHIALPPPGGEKALRELVSELMSTPLDTTKPLWHVHLVDGYDRGSVVLARIHHSIADGIALVRVMLSLTDATPTPKPAKRKVESTNHAGPLDWLPGLLDNPARLADLARLGVHGPAATRSTDRLQRRARTSQARGVVGTRSARGLQGGRESIWRHGQ